MVVLGYLILILLSITGFLSVLFGLISTPLLAITKSVFVSSLVSAISIWLLIGLLWRISFDEQMPILVIGLSIAGMCVWTKLQKSELSKESKTLIGGEILGTILFCIYYFVRFKSVNWV